MALAPVARLGQYELIGSLGAGGFRPGNYIPYDVLPDGTFVINSVVASAKPAAPATLRVLLNWETLIRK